MLETMKTRRFQRTLGIAVAAAATESVVKALAKRRGIVDGDGRLTTEAKFAAHTAGLAVQAGLLLFFPLARADSSGDRAPAS